VSLVTSKARVGFIGLGNQGAPMARRIADAGFPLTIWARRAEALLTFADADATVADTPAELGAASDVVGVCVVDDSGVDEVVLGATGVLAGMEPGGIVVIHSTVHPDTCTRLATVAAERGVRVVDAPVSGGGAAAAAGCLLVMVGGATGDVATVMPVLCTFGNPVLHVGGLGSGQAAKLLNNLACTAHISVALALFSLAVDLDVDLERFAEVLACGSGGSQVAAVLASAGFTAGAMRQHAAPILRKDIELALDLMRMRDTRVPHEVVSLAQHSLAILEHPEPPYEPRSAKRD